ncbi:MAG TPA: hypothetical protein VHP11_12745 [Tepidisphaeraceae bacterium]|nr:hypothetical protein [Tepidisphaeraceae bacterium]
MILHRDDVARRWVSLCMFAATGVLLCAPYCQAQISSVELFRTGLSVQTGNGNTLLPGGYYFLTTVNSVHAFDLTGGTLTYPGPSSPATLSSAGPTKIDYSSFAFDTKAQLDAAYPAGTYSYLVGNGATGYSTSLNYTADFYPQSLPYLDSTTYADLQGMNPQVPFTFDFSPFQTGPGVSASFILFTLYDLNSSDETPILDAGLLPPSTTGFVLPANTLQPGHLYHYEMFFSNRVSVASPGAENPGLLGFDYRTNGEFTPAVPEPVGLSMLAVAGIGLLGRRRNR